jgi:hypothetical protein
MKSSTRMLLGVAVFIAVYFLCWPALLLLTGGHLGWLANVGALVLAILAARRTWVRTESGDMTPLFAAGLGAATVGACGFAIGFVGPMILAPDANQGPLLGIFITGPLGAVLGAFGGYLVGRRRARAS